jgi:hypothetical protein
MTHYLHVHIVVGRDQPWEGEIQQDVLDVLEDMIARKHLGEVFRIGSSVIQSEEMEA